MKEDKGGNEKDERKEEGESFVEERKRKRNIVSHTIDMLLLLLLLKTLHQARLMFQAGDANMLWLISVFFLIIVLTPSHYTNQLAKYSRETS